MAKIQRALISVSDKTGLVPFAQILARAGIEMISTGGTAKTLREAGLAVKDISEHTGFPEMLDGRVKTLHPKVHGGLLFIRGKATHETAVQAHGIAPIDLVVVNLYPFEQTVARPDVTLHEAIENIDIGGPSMLRSAAKNHESVTVVVDPLDYAEVGETDFGPRQHHAGTAASSWRRKSLRAPRLTTAPLPRICKRNSGPRRLPTCLPRSMFSHLWRSRCVTVKTRIRRRRSTAASTNFSSNCTARNFPTTTSWI